MKNKKQIPQKLSFKKNTILKLSNQSMRGLMGGGDEDIKNQHVPSLGPNCSVTLEKTKED